MRRPFAILSASLFLTASSVASQAVAADVAATSRIDAVTVFPSGAEVTRLTKVKLEAGEQCDGAGIAVGVERMTEAGGRAAVAESRGDRRGHPELRRVAEQRLEGE